MRIEIGAQFDSTELLPPGVPYSSLPLRYQIVDRPRQPIYAAVWRGVRNPVATAATVKLAACRRGD